MLSSVIKLYFFNSIPCENHSMSENTDKDAARRSPDDINDIGFSV